MKLFAVASCIGILSFGVANAQEYSKMTADIGGGYTTPVGTAGRYLETGWNVGAGLGYNFSSHLGAKLDFGYDSLGLNGGAVQALGVPGGQVHIFQATIDPVMHLTPASSRLDVYVMGGGGVFHRYQEISGVSSLTGSADVPYLGVFPVSVGASQVLPNYTVTKPGFDVGAGVAVGAIGRGKFFMEAKWDHMFLNYGHTDYIPVTFGFRH